MKKITLIELTNKVGIECMLEINNQVSKLSNLLRLKFNLSFFEKRNEYVVKNEKRIILIIDKKLLYIKPYEFFKLKTLIIFDDYENHTGEKFGETILYDNLIKLQDKIDLFIYYYIIYVTDYFNLEVNETKITKTKDNIIVIDSIKYEFVYDDAEKTSVTYKKITFILYVSMESDVIKTVKIYQNGIIENNELKILDIV